MATIAFKTPHRIDANMFAVLALLILVIGAGFALSERFGSTANFSNVLEQAAALGFVSLGQTIVVLAGGIDLSIGALVSALTVLIATLCESYPDATPFVIALAVLGGIAVGAANAGVMIALRVHPLVVTIGTAALLNGVTLMVTRQPTGSIPVWLEEFAFGRLLGVPFAGFAMLLAFAAAGLWLSRHPHGRRIYAIGGSPEAARLTGIPVQRTMVVAYALSGLLAALAAIYYVARTGTGDPLVGESLTLASITPVVVGGTLLGGGRGGVLGTLLGVFLIAFLNNVLNYMNISTFLQWVVQGLIIIAAVSFHANGRRRS